MQFPSSPTCTHCLQTLAAFGATNWEQQPLHIAATEDRKQLFNGLFDINTFKDLAAKRDVDEELGSFQFGADLNAARYEDGKRTTPNGQVGARYLFCSSGSILGSREDLLGE